MLVNSIGGSTWSSEGSLRAMSERPLGDWGVHLGAELLSARGLTRVLPVVASDALSPRADPAADPVAGGTSGTGGQPWG